MAEELLIQVTDFESRVALVKDGAVHEVHIARSSGYSATGNIYLGKVVRIVPGMQAAFIDIGLERPGFLHASDVQTPLISTGQISGAKPTIRDLLHDGQELLVQVDRDPIGTKGARLSTRLALASKYLVLTPTSEQVALSQRIKDDGERQRLFALLRPMVETGGFGVIARTQGESAQAQALQQDYHRLVQQWQAIEAQRKDAPSGRLVHCELPVQTRLIRDLVGPETATIDVDDPDIFRLLQEYLDKYAPDYKDILRLYRDQRPMFERHNIEDEIAGALQPRVRLHSGGTLVIEQTEAMVSIDVNTASFLGSKNLEETAFQTNLEAAAAIPRQLRLRNLGGIVVIDFIDMTDPTHRESVLEKLQQNFAGDPAKTRVLGFSDLGLVQVSRKRSRESLIQQLCGECPHCLGLGSTKTPESTCMDVFRALSAEAAVSSDKFGSRKGTYSLVTTAAVADRLLEEEADIYRALLAQLGHDLRLQVDPEFPPGRFDLFFVAQNHH